MFSTLIPVIDNVALLPALNQWEYGNDIVILHNRIRTLAIRHRAAITERQIDLFRRQLQPP